MDKVSIFTGEKRNNLYRIKVLLISAIGLAVVCLLYTFNPADSRLYAPCFFHALTGLYCPGCGSLRAIHQLLHMHFLSAFKLNPLLVLSIPLLGYLLLRPYLFRPGKHLLRDTDIPAFLILIYLGIVVSFWIIRNTPLYPFSLLTP
jgi:hypothetical protein